MQLNSEANASESALNPLDSLSRNYRILNSLGVGATAQVYRARPLNGARQGQDVALKVFFPSIVHDPLTVERIQNEAQVLSDLVHPYILRFHQVIRSPQVVALELEYIHGRSLKAWSEAYQFPLLEPRVWILSRVAKALAFAHERKTLHRDLKPENILISETGEVRLSDFGLAKSLETATLTRSGVMMGSLCYMAPEVFAGEPASEATDLFAFGVIAYELLTGRLPFDGPSPQAIMRKISEGQFASLKDLNPMIPTSLGRVIESCLSVKASERPDYIWTVDAVLMTWLVRSPVQNYCCDIVASETRAKALQMALQVKLSSLTQAMQLALDHDQDFWAEAAEYQRLFPDGERMPWILENLSNASKAVSKEKTFRGPIVFVLSLLFIFVVAGTIWKFRTPVAVSSSANSVSAGGRTSAPSLGTEASSVGLGATLAAPGLVAPHMTPQHTDPSGFVKSRHASAAGQTRPAAASPKYGYVSFQVPDDVEIFVNDVQVPDGQRLKYRLKVGTHQLRLLKPGFLPIENEVAIKSSMTSYVRAGQP